MEIEQKKRKIKIYKILEIKHLHKKQKITKFVQVKPCKTKNEKIEKTKKDKNLEGDLGKEKSKFTVSKFQLVVVKIPWYKKAFRSVLGFFGLYYG